MKKIAGLIAAVSVFAGITALAQDNSYVYNKFISTVLIPQIGLCDIQKSYLGHEDEDINQYFSGLISAFTLDMNSDGSDELITVEDDAVCVYEADNGSVNSLGSVSRNLITDMGESYANVFVHDSYVGIETYSDTGASRKYSMYLFGMNDVSKSLVTAAKIERTLSDGGLSEFATGLIGNDAISYSHVKDGDFESFVNNNGYEDINAAAEDILFKLNFNASELTVFTDRLSFADNGMGGGDYRINSVVPNAALQTYVQADNIRLGGTPVVRFEDHSRLPEFKEQPDIITVTIDGSPVDFTDAVPVIVDDRTLVPMRKIFEELGCAIEWHGDEGKAAASRMGVQIILTVGSDEMTVNGVAKKIEVPAMVINDRTFVPVRAISEALDCVVNWDAEKREVIIESNQ